MKTVSPELARELIDFAPNQAAKEAGFGESQLEGTVAAYNMLARNHCAYLADEVGMGKTYVALGVMSLFRHLKPDARIVVIAPRENIQRKWIKELRNFVRLNWQVRGNRVKSIQGTPAWEPVFCDRLIDFGREIALNADRDFFLRMTSFSLAVKESKPRKRLRKKLRGILPWIDGEFLRPSSPDHFLANFGQALNAAIPPIDLLVVDEAHNLKHGFGPRQSIRNRMMAYVFGHPDGGDADTHWYGRRVKNLLLLSATPFEDDYAAIQKQLEIFGFGDRRLAGPNGEQRQSVAMLRDSEVKNSEKKALVSRLMLRRVASLQIAGDRFTKNMYRREWRSGGLIDHDKPLSIDDPKQRLIVALVQKKVAEVLQDERFNNQFQIGMLSSFESFLESIGRMKAPSREDDDTEEAQVGTFDGDQNATDHERQGIDTAAIGALLESYRERFDRPLPHPKLDATAGSLDTAFDTGEKALVFVRRVATVAELAAKLDAAFDTWLRERMHRALPDLRAEVDTLFERYSKERRLRPDEILEEHNVDSAEGEAEDVIEGHEIGTDVDSGSAETFFAWFFRGAGPKNVLSGGALQRNRLGSTSSAYSTVFEDDHIDMLLGRPNDTLGRLAKELSLAPGELSDQLARHAYNHFRERSQQQKGYPRLYVFEAYQAVGLELLAASKSPLSEDAQIILGERHREAATVAHEAPAQFPRPEEAIGIRTFFTELARRPELREALWPEEHAPSFRIRFRRQEQRRELLSAMARLGAPYIDLYLLAIRQLGGFGLRGEAEGEHPEEALVQDYLDLLEVQRSEPGFHSFRELSDAANAFDLLIAVNFPDVPHAHLEELADYYGATLQRQVPVGRMAGGVNKRLVRQFRMPGFPLVLATTDVLQEGEDLHTFCRRVIHYGISWTPSAMEQRTGRIDRIGGLVQREIDGCDERPSENAFIQVFYPHLQDTVEVLQVRRVLARVNRFLRLIHNMASGDEAMETRIDANREMLEELADVEPIRGPLESAFPVSGAWLEGELTESPTEAPNIQGQLDHLDRIWEALLAELGIQALRTGSERMRAGVVFVNGRKLVPHGAESDDHRHKRFHLELRSQAAGDATLLRCASPVGMIDLTDPEMLDSLYELQRELGGAKVCIHPDSKIRADHITIEADIPFHPKSTRVEELRWLIARTAITADVMEARILGVDNDDPDWKPTGDSDG